MGLLAANTRLEEELIFLIDKTRKLQKLSRSSWMYLAIVEKLYKSFSDDKESLDLLKKIHPIKEVTSDLK